MVVDLLMTAVYLALAACMLSVVPNAESVFDGALDGFAALALVFVAITYFADAMLGRPE